MELLWICCANKIDLIIAKLYTFKYYPFAMSVVFVAVTEEFYGGEEDSRVFRKEDDAERYADAYTKRDCIVIRVPFIGDINAHTVFMIVTDQWYGGGEDKIRVFEKVDDSRAYVESLHANNNYDVLALEKELQ